MSKQQDALLALEETAQSLKDAALALDASSAYDEGRLMGYYEALRGAINALVPVCNAGHLTGGSAPGYGLSPGIAIAADFRCARRVGRVNGA